MVSPEFSDLTGRTTSFPAKLFSICVFVSPFGDVADGSSSLLKLLLLVLGSGVVEICMPVSCPP